jgi:hypothetical protein
MSNSAASKRRSRTNTSSEDLIFDLLCWHARPQRGAAIVLGLPGLASCTPTALFAEEQVAVFCDRAESAKSQRGTERLIELGWMVFRLREHRDDYETFVAGVVAAVRDRNAALAESRATHAATHDAHAWCERCEQWPHRPWPIGIDGWCLRCLVHADEHADIYGSEFASTRKESIR